MGSSGKGRLIMQSLILASCLGICYLYRLFLLPIFQGVTGGGRRGVMLASSAFRLGSWCVLLLILRDLVFWEKS